MADFDPAKNMEAKNEADDPEETFYSPNKDMSPENVLAQERSNDNNPEIGFESGQGKVQAEIHEEGEALSGDISRLSTGEMRMLSIEDKMGVKYGYFADDIMRRLMKAHITSDGDAYFYSSGGKKLQLTYKASNKSKGISKGDFKSREMLAYNNAELAREFKFRS